MSDLFDRATTVFRDFNTVGDSLSGAYEPTKAAARALFAVTIIWAEGWITGIVNSPTGDEADGERYIVGTSPSGLFGPYANHVAIKVDDQWQFSLPPEGAQALFNRADGRLWQYSSGAWGQTSAATLGLGTAANHDEGDFALSSLTVTAGSGLSGGGALTSNISLAADVLSVAGRTGAVTLSTSDIAGLGTAATHAASDFMQGANNLSDVASPSTALSTLGGAAKSANLSDLANVATARANLTTGSNAQAFFFGDGSLANLPKLFFASRYATLSDADSAATAGNGLLVLDKDYTLSANTTLTSKVIGMGGVITRGTYTLSGNFWAPSNVQMFDASGTGAVTLSGTFPEVYEKWFGVTRDGTTNDYNAVTQARICASLSGRTIAASKGAASLSYSGTTGIVPVSGEKISGTQRGTTIDYYQPSTNFAFGITQSNGPLTLSDITLKLSPTASQVMQGISYAYDYLTLSNVEIDGTITDNGTSTSHDDNGIQSLSTGAQNGLFVYGGNFHHTNWCFAKNNSDTSAQTFGRIVDVEMHHNYRNFAGFNSPNGSQSDIQITRCYLHDPLHLPSTIFSSLGIAWASGTAMQAYNNRLVGDFYQGIHIEENVKDFFVGYNTFNVSTKAVHLQPANHNASATWYWPIHGVITGNVATQSGTSLATTSVAYSFDESSTGYRPAENVLLHHNISYGAGFERGFSASVNINYGAGNRIQDNLFNGHSIGMYLDRMSGGIGVENNMTVNCTTDIEGSNVVLKSHKFVNPTTAFTGTESSAGIGIHEMEFEWNSVNIGASTDFKMMRLESNDRFDLQYAVVTGVSNTPETCFASYRDGTWDGTTWTAPTLRLSKSGTYLTVTLSRKSISGTNYLVATAADSGGGHVTGVTVHIKGFYLHGGV